MLRNAIEQFEGEAADEYDDGAVLKYDSNFPRVLFTFLLDCGIR